MGAGCGYLSDDVVRALDTCSSLENLFPPESCGRGVGATLAKFPPGVQSVASLTLTDMYPGIRKLLLRNGKPSPFDSGRDFDLGQRRLWRRYLWVLGGFVNCGAEFALAMGG